MTEAEERVHSRKYEKVREYYNGGYWNEARVRNAVAKGWITGDEFMEITGDAYAEQGN